MPEYDNRGRVSLWRPDTDHPAAPKLTGTVIAHRSIAEGETLSIGLWLNDNANPKSPVMDGKISDYIKKGDQAPPHQPNAPPPAEPPANYNDFKDDDLPF